MYLAITNLIVMSVIPFVSLGLYITSVKWAEISPIGASVIAFGSGLLKLWGYSMAYDSLEKDLGNKK